MLDQRRSLVIWMHKQFVEECIGTNRLNQHLSDSKKRLTIKLNDLIIIPEMIAPFFVTSLSCPMSSGKINASVLDKAGLAVMLQS